MFGLKQQFRARNAAEATRGRRRGSSRSARETGRSMSSGGTRAGRPQAVLVCYGPCEICIKRKSRCQGMPDTSSR
jgi:hypothetical protein